MKSLDDKGGPAFPTLGKVNRADEWEPHSQYFGLTARDYFAARAMEAILSAYLAHCYSTGARGIAPDVPAQISINAYELADAMLRAREE